MYKIFICYSHDDEFEKIKVCNFLKVYGSELDVWDDRRISAGEEWKEEIMKSLNECDAAIMLISNSFLISDFIRKIEIPKLLNRREIDNIPIWPFILKPCDWEHIMDLGKLQAHPKDARPYQSFSGHKREEVLKIFSREVFDLLNTKESRKTPASVYEEIENNEFLVDRDTSLIVQLDQFFKQKFKDIKVLPSDYYLNEYPFKNGIKNNSSRSSFTISLNKELSELFDSIKISKSGALQNTFTSVKEFECVHNVLTTLRRNLITHVRIGEKRVLKGIKIGADEDKFEPIDLYDSFRFKEALENSPSILESDDLDTKIQKGYYFYLIGEYYISSEHFKKALELAKNESNDVKVYICSHNLYHLGRLIEFNFWNLPNKKAIVDDLTKFELDELINNEGLEENFKKLFKNDSFFSDAERIIRKESSKIVDRYYSYLDGGRSSNNYNYEIYYQYGILNSFLSLNHIIYDDYYDYKEVCHHFIESIFASYSIKNGNAKIEEINDYILWNIIKYADISVLEKHVKRYSIRKLNYSTFKWEFNFEQLFKNLFGTPDLDLEESISLLSEDNKGRFRIKVETERIKFLFLMGKLRLKPAASNRISNVILSFINNDFSNLKRGRSIKKYIYSFFINQADSISKRNINQFLLSVYKIKDMHDSNYLSQFLNVCERNDIQLRVSNKNFNDLILSHVELELKNDSKIRETEISLELYNFLSSKQQLILKDIYLKKLQITFNFDLFYLLVMYGLIPYDYNNHLWSYIDKINFDKFINNDFRYVFSLSNVNRYSEVDKILNILFMSDVNLNQSRIQRFAEINNYYNWILNLESHNYKDFDPYWVDEYDTLSYRKHFKKSHELKNQLNTYLQNNIDRRIDKLYNNIYCN